MYDGICYAFTNIAARSDSGFRSRISTTGRKGLNKEVPLGKFSYQQ